MLKITYNQSEHSAMPKLSVEENSMNDKDDSPAYQNVQAPKSAVHYADINELPIPVRLTLVRLSREQKMSDTDIAKHFSLPVEWVMMFTQTPPGSPEH